MNDNIDIPEFTRLDLSVVWRLGRDLVEQCLQEGHGVTICAKIGQQHVFHAALPGTSADNDAWVHRKLRVVEHFGIPSLIVQEQFVTESRDFYRDFGLEPPATPPRAALCRCSSRGRWLAAWPSPVLNPSTITTSHCPHYGGGARDRGPASARGKDRAAAEHDSLTTGRSAPQTGSFQRLGSRLGSPAAA